MMIWHRTWCGSTWYCSEWSGLASSVSMLHVRIEDDLTYLSAKFKVKISNLVFE